MRRLVLALLATGGLALAWTAPAEAVGTRYPFCMQGDETPGLSDCSYTSYQQCQATASGRFLTCVANPYYAGDSGYAGDTGSPRGRGRPGYYAPY
jgi:hypothetical protein